MIEFAWPWMFLLLPLPLLARLLPPAEQGPRAALRVPFIDDFERGDAPLRRGKRLPLLLGAALAWLLLVIAAAHPQWLGEPLDLPLAGRDLMLAMDISGSMQEQDFELNGHPVERITATKKVAGDFIQRREGDRIGLILFGDQAYLQTPLTFDRSTVRTLLDEAAIGLAGKATAIGDAIGLGLKRLRDRDAKSRVLILLTDGANTAGEVKPLQAAEMAAQEGLRIYTIGIGADRVMRESLFGIRMVSPSRELDEETLKGIADKTGGRYFRARDTGELRKIYQLLDELEPAQQESQRFRPTRSLYPWPLGLALLLGALVVTLRWRAVE